MTILPNGSGNSERPLSLTLVIANKTYSSWLFRPWILMRDYGIAFDEIMTPLAQDNTREEILLSSIARWRHHRMGLSCDHRISRRNPSRKAALD